MKNTYKTTCHQLNIFVAPAWKWIVHGTDAESVLFSYSDRAAQQKLGFWREQRDLA